MLAVKPEKLIALAQTARTRAYAPYSNFSVGAALLTAKGNVYLGCNIENAAYGPSNCAERTAIFKAVSEGERDFAALAVVADVERPIAPCGVCRQVMTEFFTDQVEIYLANGSGQYQQTTISQLLPGAFTSEKYGI